jgi:hypothetical protein
LQGKGEGSTFLAPPQLMGVPSTEYPSTPNAKDEPTRTLPAKPLSEQPYFLMFYYSNKDHQELGRKLQDEIAPELRRRFPIGISFLPIAKGEEEKNAVLPDGRKVERLPTYFLFYNGKMVLERPGPLTTEQLVELIESVGKVSPDESEAEVPGGVRPKRATTPSTGVPSTQYPGTPNATPAPAQAASPATDNVDIVTVERTTPDGRIVYEQKVAVPRTTVTTPVPGEDGGWTPYLKALQKSDLRYEGKTFDEWRAAWKTELSTNKRVEAVKALAAFGANGHGKDAAQAILEVAGQYDWTSIGGNKMIEPLQNACVEALAGPSFGEPRAVPQRIPVGDAMPAISAAAKSGNQRQKMFLTYVLLYLEMPESIELRLMLSKDQDATVRKYALPTLPTLGYDGHDEKISERIREALKSNDPEEIAAAMRVIWPEVNKAAGEPYPYLSELAEWIFSPHEAIRKQARSLLSGLKGNDATHMADVALAVLKDESKTEQHIEAIRALAALGPNAKSAVDSLRPLLNSEKQPIAVASNVALTRILKRAEYNKLLYDELGKRFELGWEVEGRSLGLPSGEKQEEYEAFQRAANDELRQVFP